MERDLEHFLGPLEHFLGPLEHFLGPLERPGALPGAPGALPGAGEFLSKIAQNSLWLSGGEGLPYFPSVSSPNRFKQLYRGRMNSGSTSR